MSEVMHSPGPWEWYGPTRGEGLTFTNEAHVGPGEGNDIAGPIAAVGGDDKEQAVANAKLIAASPDLLAACEAVLEYITHPEGSAPNGLRLITATDLLRKVIAKATS